MVTVELRRAAFDQETNRPEWETVVTIEADADNVTTSGDRSQIDWNLPVLSIRSGQRIQFQDDPEEWVRSLPSVYHAPDLIATVVEDTNPPEAPKFKRSKIKLNHPVTR